MSYTIEQLTQAAVETRKERDALRQKHKEEMAGILERETIIENALLAKLNEDGLNSAPNQYGTPYKTTTNSFPVKDREAFFDFAFENGLKHMIEARASKSSVEEYVEGHGDLPPGLSMKSVVRVNVRKAR